VVQAPLDNLTLSAADGEALLARVHRSDLPRADAETVAWLIRLDFYGALALQEGTLNLARLRALLFGTQPSPSPEQSLATSQVDGEEASPCSVVAAEAEAGAMTDQTPQPSPPTGGHHPGTGRLGAAAYGGAVRIECRPEDLAVGQRGPVCGQGTLSALPAGVESRIDGNALRSARRYALEKLRGSACGAICTAGLPEGVGDETYSARARAVLVVSRYALGGPGSRLPG
jgi:hypothetical protein